MTIVAILNPALRVPGRARPFYRNRSACSPSLSTCFVVDASSQSGRDELLWSRSDYLELATSTVIVGGVLLGVVQPDQAASSLREG